EPVEQRLNARPPREIQRERVAAHRKGKIAAPLPAQRLQDCKKGSSARAGDFFEHQSDASWRRFIRQDALELVEAAATVDAVPISDRIQRVKELPVWHDTLAAACRHPAIIGCIEHADREWIQDDSGRVQRYATATLRPAFGDDFR